MSGKKKTPSHVGMAGNVLLCNACGSRQELTVPQPVHSVVGLMQAWTKAHAKCTGNTPAFREATSLESWMASDDTGMSSRAIYFHMRGFPATTRYEGRYPHDPEDFGRCYRLLKLEPKWKLRIGEMTRYGEVWAKLAAAWDELTALYEEELPKRTCPKLYARMKELGA